MEKKNSAYYLGIDLCNTYAMVSFYQLNMEEPDTEEPYPIKTAQLNTDKPIPEKRNTDSRQEGHCAL